MRKNSKLLNLRVGAFFATVCAAMLLPQCVGAEQIDPSQFARTFNITFPGYTGTETLTDFPVLIRLSAELNDFDYSKCKASNGGDVRFADSDGNLLVHEIDTWDENGTSLVWVKVTSLNSSTEIRVYYGCENPPANDPTAVWSNGYVGVWHMDETTRKQNDSTSNGKTIDGSSTYTANMAYGVDGAVGKAVEQATPLDNGAYRGGFQCTDSGSLYSGTKTFTLEMWACHREIVNDKYIFRLKNSQGTTEYSARFSWPLSNKDETKTQLNCSVLMTNLLTDTKISIDPKFTVSTSSVQNVWTQYAIVVDNETLHRVAAYCNGASQYTKSIGDDDMQIFAGAGTFAIGNSSSGGTQAFPGSIDEVRVSNVARSDDWMKASYDTVHDVSFAAFEHENDWTKYAYKFTIEFPGAPEATLTDFPVLVKLAEYDETEGSGIGNFSYAAFAKPDGGDLRFADANGNMLAHEIDTWDEGGVSTVWVKVPSLSSSMKITAYYGWKFAPAVNSRDVWSNGYIGVWHLNETARPLMNSTSTAGIDFTRSDDGSPARFDDCIDYAQSGAVGASVKFGTNHGTDPSKDNMGGLIAYDPDGKLCGLGEMTMEIWAKVDEFDTAHTRYMLSRRMGNYVSGVKVKAYDFKYTADRRPVAKFYYNDGNVDNNNGSCELKPSAMSTSLDGQWNYHCACYDKSLTSQTNYLNGAVAKTATSAGEYSIPAIPDPLCLGNDCKPSTYNNSTPSVFNGALDELRISNVTRSSDWVKATYDTIKNNAEFTTYGSVREQVKGLKVIFR